MQSPLDGLRWMRSDGVLGKALVRPSIRPLSPSGGTKEEIIVFDAIALGRECASASTRKECAKNAANMLNVLHNKLLAPFSHVPSRTYIFLFDRCGKRDDTTVFISCFMIDAIEMAISCPNTFRTGCDAFTILLAGVLPMDENAVARRSTYRTHTHDHFASLPMKWDEEEEGDEDGGGTFGKSTEAYNILELAVVSTAHHKLRLRRALWVGPPQFRCDSRATQEERVASILWWHVKRSEEWNAAKAAPPLSVLLKKRRVIVDVCEELEESMRWNLFISLYFQMAACSSEDSELLLILDDDFVVDICDAHARQWRARMQRLIVVNEWLVATGLARSMFRFTSEKAVTRDRACMRFIERPHQLLAYKQERIRQKEQDVDIFLLDMDVRMLVEETTALIRDMIQPSAHGSDTKLRDPLQYATQVLAHTHEEGEELQLPSYDAFHDHALSTVKRLQRKILEAYI